MSKLFFSLDQIKPQYKTSGGSITHVTGNEVEGFVDISFSLLNLKPKGCLEPIWHPNANKIGYCQQGKALVTLRNPEKNETFTVNEGDVFFIPEGYIHGIENIGSKDCIIAFAYSHKFPQVMSLSKAIHSLSNNVFNSTFNTNPGFLDGLLKSKNPELIKLLPTNNTNVQSIASRFKYDVGSSNKTIQTKGGYLQPAIKGNLPTLESLGILRFGLNPKGIVEPHWHTNAGELVYIVKGKTRITVLDPSGHVETLDVKGGEGAFAPASHFHNIENIGDEDVEVIAFFSNANPDYIGIGEVVGAYSNDVLATAFDVPSNYFDSFNKPKGPLVIVPI